MTRRPHHAFSLIEVLAAMVLMAIVLPAVMRGVTLCVQSAASSKHKLEAAQLAEGQLNALLAEKNSSLFYGSGDFGDDFPGYRWESESNSTELDLYEVVVTVYWTERGVERGLSLSTLIATE